MFKNVLVGVDRHQGVHDALALATQLMAPDGQLTLAHVYPGDSRLRRGTTLDYARVRQEQSLELLTEARDEAGVDAVLRYRESSSPGRGLHELAEAIDADLLVVGSSRHGESGVCCSETTPALRSPAPHVRWRSRLRVTRSGRAWRRTAQTKEPYVPT